MFFFKHKWIEKEKKFHPSPVREFLLHGVNLKTSIRMVLYDVTEIFLV